VAYLRISEARAWGQAETGRLQKRAAQILAEESERFSAAVNYDVFLSHSFQDAEVILGVKTAAEASGLRVYVDWIDDPGLDRDKVTAKTAGVLRGRMRASSSLVYAHSTNTPDSKWMPWELGHFDGFRPGYVWILPLVVEYDSEFAGQEYLGLYPIIEMIESVAGRILAGNRRLDLGFKHVRMEERFIDIPLSKAAKGEYGGGLTEAECRRTIR
jgi:hypothetical protein